MSGDGQGSDWREGGSVAQHSSPTALAGHLWPCRAVRSVRGGLTLRNNHVRLGSSSYGLDEA